jgi:hypothetical protein
MTGQYMAWLDVWLLIGSVAIGFDVPSKSAARIIRLPDGLRIQISRSFRGINLFGETITVIDATSPSSSAGCSAGNGKVLGKDR